MEHYARLCAWAEENDHRVRLAYGGERMPAQCDAGDYTYVLRCADYRAQVPAGFSNALNLAAKALFEKIVAQEEPA